MAATRNGHAKNTFIDIDTREMDAECMRDTRRNKTWHASTALAFLELVQEDANNFEEPAGESSTHSACRFKTYDFMDEDDVSESDDVSTSASEAAEVASPQAPPRDVSNCFHLPQLVSPLMLSAPASPVLIFQVPFAEPTMQPHQTLPWPGVQNLAPFQAPEQVAGHRVEHVPVKALSTYGTEQKGSARSAADGNSTWTCRMIRNIPNDYTRDDLVELLGSKAIQFDFIYLPIDWKKGANLGYAFVNLVSHKEAVRIQACLNGFSAWKVSSEKVCEVVWGKPEQQSLQSIVERFRNSPVMHPNVPETFKPLLLINQRRVAMPAPTRKLQQPQAF